MLKKIMTFLKSDLFLASARVVLCSIAAICWLILMAMGWRQNVEAWRILLCAFFFGHELYEIIKAIKFAQESSKKKERRSCVATIETYPDTKRNKAVISWDYVDEQ